MRPAFHTPSVKARLSIAILTLCAVTVIISTISLLSLRNAENWLDTIHRDTLSEVSQALEFSRSAADLATAAPFLLAVQVPYQRQADADAILQTIEQLETLSEGTDDLALPLARIRVAIANLLRVSSPQSLLQADIAQIDTDLAQLQDRFQRQAISTEATLDDRLVWAALSRLTSDARSVTRAQEILEVGEIYRRFNRGRAALPDNAIAADGLREIEDILTRPTTDLFQLKYQSLTAALDAENALFRIRQLSGEISAFATLRVEAAQERLRLARMQTSRDLNLAQIGVALLALFSACVAVISSLFVSRYVTRNLRLVADGMHQLAAGDHSVTVPTRNATDDEIGQLFHAFGVFRSNARKLDRRTAQITRQNMLFSSVFSGIKDGVAILTPQGKIEAENNKVRALLNIPYDAHAQTMKDLFALSVFSLQSGSDDRGGYEEYTNPMGDVIEVRSSLLPDGRSVWMLSEATERKRIEDRLEEIRRVEALGKVTGEVAHDFGNILSTISGNLHLLETSNATAAPFRLGRIRTAVDLGVSLTERLVAFARKQHLEPELVDLGSLVEGMQDLLDIALPENVTLHLDLGESPLHVSLDPGQLESALLNVCMNAAQAMPDAGNIWITLTSQNRHAVLTIKDDGIGMTEETRRHAFEPFYTARPNGEGTGLGLSMVYGFVTQSGGTIEILSAMGQGTSIVIRVPIMDTPPVVKPKIPFAGTAIVVDDNRETAAALKVTLATLGFDTLVATNYSEAQKTIEQTREIALLVSDLNLDHGHSGVQLIHATLERHPLAFAILISSRLPAQVPVIQKFHSRFGMLPKPVDRTDLVHAVTDARRRIVEVS
ncbi:HAMP domain-containing protein [Rhodobacteraceae bacterium M385]|nr:HAMP domain-containing protein [Rhodobacteraceae bacterium M385]